MYNFAYEAVVVVVFGLAALRLAGKKAIAEMTTLEMITLLAIGTVIGHAVSENELWKTLVCIAIFVAVMLIFQFLALKFPVLEKWLIGRPTLVVKDGQIQEHNLRKMRMTMEQLELRLRRKGIANLSDIRTATIEIDGRIGYELKESSLPLTRGQAEQILAALNQPVPPLGQAQSELFEKIRKPGG
ncbi:DUF421 domain-containing protein [Cohnella candidum]|uniref:DUF421 domain-containing protein n=1 Tax=Cohnella candidum TaxID=2674991 RepID=A0A3G3K5E5_9BACL|nr:YetF domain-containing protein [Cohnella candidum]AYQ74999.1 DUF421 domain-containing protein [Cohnella candidum]